MAVRGCVTLLFILLSGIVHANDQVTSPLLETAEPSTSKLTPVTQTSTASPTTSSGTTHAGVTSEAPGIMLTNATTTHHNTTNSTTQPPTTTHHNTTNSTTQPPTTTHHNTTNSTTQPPTTTHHNTTNSTTEAPTTAHTNATTAAPTTTPTAPPVPNPTVGNYSVNSDNVTVCLLAKMGLQFSFKISGNASVQTVNLDPNVTEASGTCGGGGNDSSLVLKSKEVTVHFVFTNVSDKFRLHALMLSVDLGNGSIFSDSNNNLSLWEASVGSSYMCKKELSYNITDKLAVNTFELQVQPFAVQKNMFSTAHECSMDDTSLLIPIIVGAALAGLIVIVVIAYVIGRRRTYVGYQTL
ncbi:lysosome-associated membrane glycoprotein 2 isoform X2 [Megalobrama amblycephala]|uniref:lysosome-associated membrane glycoprotein 2 isoform X2 n=1 Tax=Megalobrama amblycephala TaxID=75352 RepID=UPI002014251C|nr:lysosome-associated membrane glycoprotein 2 isoform X2 [Megalobrama amblycephala]